MRRIALLFTVLSILLLAVNLHAQAPQWQTSACTADEASANGNWAGLSDSPQEHLCEVRSIILPLAGDRMDVASTNGAIHIVGENRKDIALTVRVTAHASGKDAVQQLVQQVKIIIDGTIHDEGPQASGIFSRSGYSASYTLHVPLHFASKVDSLNGGIDIEQVEGTLRLHTTNGGIKLTEVRGDVQAHTVNGGIKASLGGDPWQGSGFTAKTVNGGVHLVVPEHCSAHLTADTVNGGISVNFPVTVQGAIGRHLDTNLGQGGPTIHLQTVNGGISVSH